MQDNNWKTTQIDHKEMTLDDAYKHYYRVDIDGDRRTAYQIIEVDI